MIEFDDTIVALGWTLVHMAWITIALALVIQLLRSAVKSPQIRYRINIVGLMSVPVIAIGIFTTLLSSSSVHSESYEMAVLASLIFESTQVEESAFSFIGWLNTHMDWIILFWFAGMMSFVIRLVFGFGMLSRLRRTSEHLSSIWMDRFENILKDYNINRPVLIGNSALIDSPLTFGFLKPIILLPMGLINALTVAEVEAVIRHELAHIARHDFIFKMIQSSVESLFYYSPGTWWLSKMINIDREQCCDDYALYTGSSKESYVKALYKVNSFQVSPYQKLSLGFGKERNQLLNRINRILKQPQEKVNVMGRLIIPLILVIIFGAISINATSDENTRIEKIETPQMEVVSLNASIPAIKIFQPIEKDTIPKSKNKSVESQVDGNGKSYSITRENGEITRMEIDGKVIPKSDYDKYINEFNQKLKSDHFDLRFDQDFGNGTYEFNDKSLEHFEKGMREFEKSMEHFGDNWEEWGKGMEKFGEEMEKWGEEFEMDEETKKKLEERARAFGERFGHEFGEKFENNFEWNFEEGEAFRLDSLISQSMKMLEGFSFNFNDEDFNFSFPTPPTPPTPPAPPVPPVPGVAPVPPVPPMPPVAPFKLEMDDLKNELRKDGFFKDSDRLRFEMDEDELKINGRKQSQSTYNKYEKIIKKSWGKKSLDNFNINFNIEDKVKSKRSSYRI